MKTKLTTVQYLGFTAMDRRFSNAMLPWLLKEIKKMRRKDKLSVTIEEGYFKAYNENFEPVITHRLVDIIRASQVPGVPEELFYILMNEREGLLNCYLYRTNTVEEVTELFVQMREPSPLQTGRSQVSNAGNAVVTKNLGFMANSTDHAPWTTTSISLPRNCHLNLNNDNESPFVRGNNGSALTSLCADLSPSDSHFFEVLYIGKVRISQRKVPDSLIDDALSKFAQHELEKAKNSKIRRSSLISSQGTDLSSQNSIERISEDPIETEKSQEFTNSKRIIVSTTPLEPDKGLAWKSAENLNKEKSQNVEIDEEFDRFTKDRIEKTNIINLLKRPSSIPLEPNVLVLNLPKNNLTTLTEDEEKQEDLHTILTDTASSITQFCQQNFLRELSPNENDCKSEINSNNPFVDDLNKENVPQTPKADLRDPLFNIPITSPEKEIQQKIEIQEMLQRKQKNVREDSPAPNLNFDEISRKPRMLLRSKSGLDTNEYKKNNMPENKPFLRDRSASIGTLNLKTPIAQVIGEQNRTMLFQVGRSELRLISPDRKQILLHRAFKDVASCVLGRSNKDHFGFVCRETAGTSESYACYVFKCESDSIATEVVCAIRQAFVAHADLIKKSRGKSPNLTCEHCPMLWYHRLCNDLEGMNEKKIHAFILRRMEQLPDVDQEQIITKYQGGSNHMYEVSDHNAFLMILLRSHCEAKQQRHIHDTAENRSEFLNQYLGGSTIFMKAKRSLSNGFDHLLKRRSSRDETNTTLINVKKEPSPLPSQESNSDPSINNAPLEVSRRTSISPGNVNSETNDRPSSPTAATSPARDSATEEQHEESKQEPASNSLMMDIFLKVGDSRSAERADGVDEASGVQGDNEQTWRQAIYRRVVEPNDPNTEGETSPKNLLGLQTQGTRKGKRSREQLRDLWRMAIDQTILLVRMEKENAKLKESAESSAVRRIKLEYAELGGCEAGASLMWDSLLSRDMSNRVSKVDRHMLRQAVIQGVPRTSRGVVWYFLAEQASLRSPPPDIKKYPNYNTPYHMLLGGLTKHQHAILIDLGRTFPQHSYYSSALGPGQLALYNILKAYSLLDPEVGYCQGLSFVAGVLLLHMEEAEAFILLRHLMFRRGLRKQYLPDMSALQVQLYQLSRLLRDHEPELHAKLEELEVSPALYAAPWMLTLFTSQFPLGFVVRVFDLIFLECLDIVFAVSLALLSVHKDGLMMCQSCEEAAEYLKHKLPDIDSDSAIYDRVMKKVHSTDISRQLADYAVEYAVLREEMPRVTTLTEANRQLSVQNQRMSEELDSAMDAITNYQNAQTRTETQLRTMEQHLIQMSRFLASHQRDLPADIKKIMQLYNKKQSFSTKMFSTKHTTDEDVKKGLRTGTSTPNLFSKITKDDVANAVRVKAEGDKKFAMKKSLSVHSGLILPTAKQHMNILEETESEDGCDSNNHESIRQERLFEQKLKQDFDDNLKRFDAKISAHIEDVDIYPKRKTMSLNIIRRKDDKIDSGFVTPLSPIDRDDVSIISHPLSDCDVEIKFDGQSTKLKQIRPTRYSTESRTSSVDSEEYKQTV